MIDSEEHYLQQYNANDYPIVLVTVDTVLLTYHDDQIKVLLVKRANHPELGKWGLPGGFLDQKQDDGIEAAAVRSVKQKTGVNPDYLEQVETVGSDERDKRGWSLSVIYTALMPFERCESHIDSVEDAQWVNIKELENIQIAFDHDQLIEKAVMRHKQKALYSFIPVFALQQPFTLTELRRVHELLIDKKIQRKSFIRRAEASGMLVETGNMSHEIGRPAMLYKTTNDIAGYRFVRNIEGD